MSAAIWDRDEGLCIYCGKPGQVIDHVLPASHGGPSRKANGVLACLRCNYKKSNLYPLDMLIRAFIHLLTHQEDISFVWEIWASRQ